MLPYVRYKLVPTSIKCSMQFRVFLDTIRAIKEESTIPGILLESEVELNNLAAGFQDSRSRKSFVRIRRSF